MIRTLLFVAGILAFLPSSTNAQSSRRGALTLQNKAVRLSIAGKGGAIVEFRFRNSVINPLNWSSSPQEDPDQKGNGGIVLQGHFLCLDRWGAPSKAEQARGVPFHGEAARIPWSMQLATTKDLGYKVLMQCKMPLARLQVDRDVRMTGPSSAATIVQVTETVTNTAKLGRVYNFVQHPSIAPPFLDNSTIVDANAELGFLQTDDGKVPTTKKAHRWPLIKIDGKTHNLRHFTGSVKSGHDVSSYRFAKGKKYGWVTAVNPKHRLLIGYVWRTSEYPWLNIWRYVDKGRVLARGFEFGTTGLHQPFGVLVKTNKALDRKLFSYIDAGEKQTKTYWMFLAQVPERFRGVHRLTIGKKQIELFEAESKRTVKIATGGLAVD